MVNDKGLREVGCERCGRLWQSILFAEVETAGRTLTCLVALASSVGDGAQSVSKADGLVLTCR